MAVTCSIRPLRLIRKLQIVVGGHSFEISTVVLALDTPRTYPILLGRPCYGLLISSKTSSTTALVSDEGQTPSPYLCRRHSTPWLSIQPVFLEISHTNLARLIRSMRGNKLKGDGCLLVEVTNIHSNILLLTERVSNIEFPNHKNISRLNICLPTLIDVHIYVVVVQSGRPLHLVYRCLGLSFCDVVRVH